MEAYCFKCRTHRDEERQVGYDKERQEGDQRRMRDLWDQDVQDGEGIGDRRALRRLAPRWRWPTFLATNAAVSASHGGAHTTREAISTTCCEWPYGTRPS